MKYLFRRLLLLAVVSSASAAVIADEVQVAVAANFSAPMKEIAAYFEKDTGYKAVLVFGSTGKLYAQIKNGAPFDMLLAADQATPQRLVKEGIAVGASQLTYAKGQLVLWSAQPGVVDDQGSVLKQAKIAHLAYANPTLAPYGAAAVEAMKSLGVWAKLQAKLVQAENISQAHQFVVSGNAEIGMLALSQVYKGGKISGGSGWVVPADLYTPIRQDVVILTRAAGHRAVDALLVYLMSDKAQSIIDAYGYTL